MSDMNEKIVSTTTRNNIVLKLVDKIHRPLKLSPSYL